MEVKNIEADLFDCYKFFRHDRSDFQILTEFVSTTEYDLIIRRLDKTGWDKPNIKVLINYNNGCITEVIEIGPCNEREKRIRKTIQENDIFLEPGYKTTLEKRLPFYNIVPSPEPQKLSREEFNTMFNTDIVILPEDLYAVGIKGSNLYMYNLYYAHYFEIIHSIKHIVSMILTYNISSQYYFIISSSDGYLQNNYAVNRSIPLKISETEYVDKGCVSLKEEDENKYPILHHKKWMFAQANKVGTPYTIDVIDRHYFYCNLYKSFRSFHCGIPFSKKKNLMVYASRRDRGNKYNFFIETHIDMNPRDYFYTDAVCKDNMYYSEKGWIDSTIMRDYKYILDLDGNSSTWDGTAWKLNSGSVIMKIESGWHQWFYDQYLPWVHYVPIKNDFSDLQEKYQWCESHQSECEQIVSNAKNLFQTVYSFNNVMKYTIQSILKTEQ